MTDITWTNDTLPTNEGRKRFEDTNGYYTVNRDSDDEPGTPCLCTGTCSVICRGECGCPACYEAYGDFLSNDW